MKKQVRVRVSDNMHSALSEYAKECGVPVAFIVRASIRYYLKAKGVVYVKNN